MLQRTSFERALQNQAEKNCRNNITYFCDIIIKLIIIFIREKTVKRRSTSIQKGLEWS